MPAKKKAASTTEEVTTVVVADPKTTEPEGPCDPEGSCLAELAEAMNEARAKSAKAEQALMEAVAAHDAELAKQNQGKNDPNAPARAHQAHLKRMNELRAERVARQRQVIAALGGAVAETTILSPIDQALSKRKRQVPSQPVKVGTVDRAG